MNNTPFSTLTLSYADWRDSKIHMVNMSYRDLQIIVDVLDDYSKLLQEHMEKNPPQNFWAKHTKDELVKHTMRISDRLADAIGLDKTYPKCKKQQEAWNDVGEDSLTLLTTRGVRKGKKRGNEQ